jgi:leader peptidase (prepilin peptidase) / N-methyltransferase
MHVELIIYALLGLVIGSFLNVCIYRIPLGKSIVLPRSSCTRCGTPIRPYDNIPVLSYLFLRGKCRTCGEPISMQYPFVELLSGMAFYACASTWNFAPPTYVNSLFLAVIIILIFIDYHHRILPNILTLTCAVAGILLSPFQTPAVYSNTLTIRAAALFGHSDLTVVLPWVGSVLGALAGGGGLLVVGLGYQKLRKRQGLGMGDVKMMAMVGAFLGCGLAFLTLFAGSLLGLLVGIYLILFRRMNLQTKLPFGVFLGIGACFSLFFGNSFLHWYLSLTR